MKRFKLTIFLAAIYFLCVVEALRSSRWIIRSRIESVRVATTSLIQTHVLTLSSRHSRLLAKSASTLANDANVAKAKAKAKKTKTSKVLEENDSHQDMEDVSQQQQQLDQSTKKRVKAKGSERNSKQNGDGLTLVIVESPAKARTIQKFVNSDEYIIDYCAGHVRDLPGKGMTKGLPPHLKKVIVVDELKLNAAYLGINVDEGFEPLYVPMEGKMDILNRLQKHLKKCSRVLLATGNIYIYLYIYIYVCVCIPT